MLHVDDLSKQYGLRVLFQHMSFSLQSKERLGLLGRNGHGKSTLLRILVGEEEKDAGTITSPKDYQIGYLRQRMHFSQVDILTECVHDLPVEPWKAEKMLSGLGFSTEDFARPAHVFSGGYQIRVHLARLLLSEPHLLLLDEPTNYLDILSIRWLTQFLRAWKGEAIIASHDREFLDTVCTHMLLIHRCKAKKLPGDTAHIYARVAEEEEIHQRMLKNQTKERERMENFIRSFRAHARFAGLVQSRIKMLDKKSPLSQLPEIRDTHFSFRFAQTSVKQLLSVEQLAFAYQRPAFLFQTLDLSIQAGDRIGIVGPNGKGKSTLLKVLAGVLEPSLGQRSSYAGLQMGLFLQSHEQDTFTRDTVEEEILASMDTPHKEQARHIAAAMMFEGEDALKPIQVLSGGERARVQLAKLLTQKAHILLLDEPSNHLDMYTVDSLIAALAAFEGAIVLVSHNELILRALTTKLVVFDRGMVRVFDEDYQSFLDTVGWEKDGMPIERILKPHANSRTISADKERQKLRKQITRLEAEITASEGKKAQWQILLGELSTKQEFDRIPEVQAWIQSENAKLEKAFTDLEYLYLEEEEQQRL